MAATVVVQEINGPSGSKTYTTITSARFCTSDTYNPGTDYPIPIPESGFNYSYWKHFCLDISGTFTKVYDIKFYGPSTIDWGLGTGGEVRVGQRDSGDHGCPHDTTYHGEDQYAQASGTEGETGYPIEDDTNGHPYYRTQTTPVVDVTTYTSSNKMQVDSNEYTSAAKSKAVVLQVKVASDATPGAKSAVTFTFEYSEI